MHIRPPETNASLNRSFSLPHFKASIAAECEAVKSNLDKYDIIQTLEDFLRRIQMIAVEVKLPVETRRPVEGIREEVFVLEREVSFSTGVCVRNVFT